MGQEKGGEGATQHLWNEKKQKQNVEHQAVDDDTKNVFINEMNV